VSGADFIVRRAAHRAAAARRGRLTRALRFWERRRMAQRRVALAVVLTTLVAVWPAPAAAARAGTAPTPGAAGIGDPLFPRLGNGGYDVLHYDLRLRYGTSAPSQAVDGTIRVIARATQALLRFDLDFAGSGVGDVFVNGREATWARDGEELVVTPSRPLRSGQVFSTRVRHFTATPTTVQPGQATVAFFSTPDGSATAPQPDLAHRLFPSNDHPRDKARFTFTLDVPQGTTAVANGTIRMARKTPCSRSICGSEPANIRASCAGCGRSSNKAAPRYSVIRAVAKGASIRLSTMMT